VLAHKDAVSDLWVLPGGSCELGEGSMSCLRRELREELDAEVQVGRFRVLARSRSASTSCGVTASCICKVTVLHGRAGQLTS
jgi:8-oxo-dGTP pyrophosphatase MutT (NUDIX family)